MKLFYEQGPRAGQVLDVTPPGISLGRELDNDAVLEDANASRYHAKISRDNNLWTIEDLGSSNGTYLNGRKLDARTPLSLNDTIRIGDTYLRFGEESHAPSSAAPVPNAGVAGRRRSHMLALLLVFIMVLVAVVAGNAILMSSQQPVPPPSTGAKPVDPLAIRVYYEKVDVTADKTSRYMVDVRDGKLLFQEDNLESRQHREKTVVLSEDQLRALHDLLFTRELLEMPSPPAVSAQDTLRHITLAVMNGRQGNVVELVNNTIPPPGFIVLHENLRDWTQTATGLVFDIPEEMLLKESREQYDLARQLDESRNVKSENLFLAMKAYEKVLILLDGVADPPPYYKDSYDRLQAVSSEFEQRVDDLRKRAELHRAAEDWADARSEYERLRDMVPDLNHPYNEWARVRIAAVTSQMERRQR